MNSKLKEIFFEISKISVDNENFNRINYLIEDFISFLSKSSKDKFINDTFIKEIINLIETTRSENILDTLFSFFCCLIDQSLNDTILALIIFNFGKSYYNLEINYKCTRVILYYFQLNQSFSTGNCLKRYHSLKELIVLNFEPSKEINKLIESINIRIKQNSFHPYHLNLIIILLQSNLTNHQYSFLIIKNIVNNFTNLTQINLDNIFKVLYKINENLVNEINFSAKEKNVNTIGIYSFI